MRMNLEPEHRTMSGESGYLCTRLVIALQSQVAVRTYVSFEHVDTVGVGHDGTLICFITACFVMHVIDRLLKLQQMLMNRKAH